MTETEQAQKLVVMGMEVLELLFFLPFQQLAPALTSATFLFLCKALVPVMMKARVDCKPIE